MDKYEDLRILDELRAKGSITEEEFQREKEKILNSSYGLDENNRTSGNTYGMENNSYLTLMHLSQFGGFVIPGLGFILPIILWLTKSDDKQIDIHGKNITNFMISMFIYIIIAAILSFMLIGIPILIALGIMQFVCIIVAAVKAYNGEYWKYPLSISFFN